MSASEYFLLGNSCVYISDAINWFQRLNTTSRQDPRPVGRVTCSSYPLYSLLSCTSINEINTHRVLWTIQIISFLLSCALHSVHRLEPFTSRANYTHSPTKLTVSNHLILGFASAQFEDLLRVTWSSFLLWHIFCLHYSSLYAWWQECYGGGESYIFILFLLTLQHGWLIIGLER